MKIEERCHRCIYWKEHIEKPAQCNNCYSGSNSITQEELEERAIIDKGW